MIMIFDKTGVVGLQCMYQLKSIYFGILDDATSLVLKKDAISFSENRVLTSNNPLFFIHHLFLSSLPTNIIVNTYLRI